MPFVPVVVPPGRYHLGAAIRISRTAPSPGPQLYQLTFHGPLLAHSLMHCFSRHVSACVRPCTVSLSRLSILVQRPMLSKARICPPSRYAVCADVHGELRPHGPWSHGKLMGWEYFIFLSYLEHTLMHCYLVRLALQDSGPLARYPAATRRGYFWCISSILSASPPPLPPACAGSLLAAARPKIVQQTCRRYSRDGAQTIDQSWGIGSLSHV